MTVYVFIRQRPLKVTTYTSLAALYEANKSIIDVSRSTLYKWNFNSFDYVNSRFIIAKTESLSTGDIRKVQQ
jgi:peptidoglycan/xylan/chitin deacetylase (PgdA/CDA1 family)